MIYISLCVNVAELLREIPTDMFWAVFTVRRVCIVQTMLSQDVRLSVRYTDVLYRNG